MFKVLRAIFGFFVPTAPVSPAKETETVTPDLTSQVEEILPEQIRQAPPPPETRIGHRRVADLERILNALQPAEPKRKVYTMRRFHARKMSKMVRSPNFH
jgi:hypothetical protein